MMASVFRSWVTLPSVRAVNAIRPSPMSEWSKRTQCGAPTLMTTSVKPLVGELVGSSLPRVTTGCFVHRANDFWLKPEEKRLSKDLKTLYDQLTLRVVWMGVNFGHFLS